MPLSITMGCTHIKIQMEVQYWSSQQHLHIYISVYIELILSIDTINARSPRINIIQYFMSNVHATSICKCILTVCIWWYEFFFQYSITNGKELQYHTTKNDCFISLIMGVCNCGIMVCNVKISLLPYHVIYKYVYIHYIWFWFNFI